MSGTTTLDGNALFEALARAETDLTAVARALRHTEGNGREAIQASAVDNSIASLIGRMRGLVALDHPAAARQFKVARVTGSGTGPAVGPKIRAEYRTPTEVRTGRDPVRAAR